MYIYIKLDHRASFDENIYEIARHISLLWTDPISYEDEVAEYEILPNHNPICIYCPCETRDKKFNRDVMRNISNIVSSDMSDKKYANIYHNVKIQYDDNPLSQSGIHVDYARFNNMTTNTEGLSRFLVIVDWYDIFNMASGSRLIRNNIDFSDLHIHQQKRIIYIDDENIRCPYEAQHIPVFRYSLVCHMQNICNELDDEDDIRCKFDKALRKYAITQQYKPTINGIALRPIFNIIDPDEHILFIIGKKHLLYATVATLSPDIVYVVA